ncbi:enolase C-terminal domain-like protein [Amnibacterium endophyticum]|uniref:Enolase C-terminal domain-like protein n=1 Tax=Amnibacterium endophyticum TaxID=2109337 RepID=A0ABW4LG39_9MICO
MAIETSVDVFAVPTPEPETDGTARWTATTVVAVRLGADGEEGLGWSYTEAAAAALVRDVLAPAFGDADPDDVPLLRHRMRAAVRNAGATGVAAAALSAVDVALWDLKARRAGRSVASLFGRIRQEAVVYGSGGFTGYDDATTAAELEHWLALGIRDAKIKIGQGWGTDVERDLARAALARRVLGDGHDLLVDANGAYSVGQAVRTGRALADLDVTWFEEPVSSDRPEQLAAVRAQVPMDVAAGEYVWRLADAQQLLEHGAVDCLQLDVTRCGGWSAWFECAALAEAHGLQVSAHCAPHLAVHAAVATPNARHLEYFVDHERVDAALFEGLPPVVDGALRPDVAAPGHGMRVARGAERYRVG